MYGTAADIWAFGAVLFQVLTNEVFAPADENNVVKVIGYIIHRIGVNDDATASSTNTYCEAKQAAEKRSVKPLVEYHGSGWAWVRAALVWKSQDRPSARLLANIPWTDTQAAAQGSDASVELAAATGDSTQGTGATPHAAQDSEPPGLQAATTLATAQGTPTEASDALQFFMADVAPEPSSQRGKKHCACSGHCYQLGHRYWKGCKDNILVDGCDYCSSCKCLVRECKRPRLQGPRCHLHKKTWSQLPNEIKASAAISKTVVSIFPCDGRYFIH